MYHNITGERQAQILLQIHLIGNIKFMKSKICALSLKDDKDEGSVVSISLSLTQTHTYTNTTNIQPRMHTHTQARNPTHRHTHLIHTLGYKNNSLISNCIEILFSL